MSYPIKAIVYRNPITGVVASAPAIGHTEPLQRGWTMRHPDGSSGIGKVPFATREEAQEWCDVHPTFQGMNHR